MEIIQATPKHNASHHVPNDDLDVRASPLHNSGALVLDSDDCMLLDEAGPCRPSNTGSFTHVEAGSSAELGLSNTFTAVWRDPITDGPVESSQPADLNNNLDTAVFSSPHPSPSDITARQPSASGAMTYNITTEGLDIQSSLPSPRSQVGVVRYGAQTRLLTPNNDRASSPFLIDRLAPLRP